MTDTASTFADWSLYETPLSRGVASLSFMVDGIHCPACVARIESVLNGAPGVVAARVNLTNRRLRLDFEKAVADPQALVERVEAQGYRLVPFSPDALENEDTAHEKMLLRALAVAGFAAANVMLLSVAVWAGEAQDMGPATRDLLHWLSALIALPAIAYAGRPFFHSAWGALRHGGVNMEVPISLAVLLAAGMSLFQTIEGNPHTYFDSAITLLFFLLIGRYLDRRARGRARSAVSHLMVMQATAITVLDDQGKSRIIAPQQVGAGMTVLVAVGERIPVDGVISQGVSDLDTALITGESLPQPSNIGDKVFAGTVNLTGPLRLEVTAVGEETLLAEIVRLVEAAEQGRARYVVLADKVVRLYAPAVHGLAALTFVGWLIFSQIGWEIALLNAIAVLIITCPCALGLAVPVVQVIASGRLMRDGILLKSATALERFARADMVVFDKTGTLTLGRPELVGGGDYSPSDLACAAGMAVSSRHPLSRAIIAAAPPTKALEGVLEVPGAGLEAPDGTRLGSRHFVGVAEAQGGDPSFNPELWLVRPGADPVCFTFHDSLREDGEETLKKLKSMGFRIALLSGDRQPVAAEVARRLEIEDWQAGCSPTDKVARLSKLAAQERHVLMVGDGLNDAPALAAAFVSLSPSSAADISQNAADAVFQGAHLAPVIETLTIARKADRLVKQNFGLAFAYNIVTIPLAMAGLVTPLIAAAAMSASSLVVIGNALRLGKRRRV